MNNIRKCPNCIQSASEAYQRGYNDAMKLFQDEILKASQLRPTQFVLPVNYTQQPLSGSPEGSPKCPADTSDNGKRCAK